MKRPSQNLIWKSLIFSKDLIWKLVYSPTYKLKENKIIPWKTNKSSVELEITTACNLKCLNCNRSVRQAPSNESMDLVQIKKFVTESIEQKWIWNNINILGGEPTLHPKFFEVIELLKKYKDFNPDSKINIVTNGYGQRVKNILAKLPAWINIRNTAKTSCNHPFGDYNVAPIDLEKYRKADFTKACEITELCGLGLTRYGYYICGAGASVDRVFGFDLGIKNLSQLKDTTLMKQRKVLCQYCGHYKDKNRAEGRHWINQEIMSPIWIKAYQEFKKQKPENSLY